MSIVRALIGGFVGTVLANNPGLVCFLGGTLVGIYVEQTYKLPSMEDQMKLYIDKAKNIEKELRKQ